MPILHLPGEMMPGQLGPISRVFLPLQEFPRLHHVERRNAFGDADHQRDARIGGFHDGVGGERRRHENHGGVRAGLLHGLRHGIEHRQVEVLGAALAGRHAADDVGAVGDGLLRVERAFLAGEALHDQSRVFVYQYAHSFASAASFTTFSAASRMSVGRP